MEASTQGGENLDWTGVLTGADQGLDFVQVATSLKSHIHQTGKVITADT